MAYHALYETPYDYNELARLIGPALQPRGKQWFVDGSVSAARHGRDWSNAKKTITQAIAVASSGDTIWVAPGTYDEAVTVALAAARITIAGSGPRGSVSIAPSTANAVPVTAHGPYLTLVNLKLITNGATGIALNSDSDKLRAFGCKIMGDNTGGQIGVKLGLNGGAEPTRGGGSDVIFDDCEIAWNDLGVKLFGNNGLAVTQVLFRACRFHNNTTASFEEGTENAGPASLIYRNLQVRDCLFDNMEDGTVPSFLLLNDDNGNTGVVAECVFPTAINSGKSLVSTKLLWVCNYHTGGVSGAQPS